MGSQGTGAMTAAPSIPRFRRLIEATYGARARRAAAGETLQLASRSGLPLAEAADALGLRADPDWTGLLDAESRRRQERRSTVLSTADALGWLASFCAQALPRWRWEASRALEIVVPAWALEEAAERMRRTGAVRANRWDTSSQRLLFKVHRGEVADVMRLQAADGLPLSRAAGSGHGVDGEDPLAFPPVQAQARLLARRALSRGRVAVVDVADLIALEDESEGGPLLSPAWLEEREEEEKAAFAAIVRAEGQVAGTGRVKLERVGGRRRRLGGRRPPAADTAERVGTVAMVGPGPTGAYVSSLSESLRRAGLEVTVVRPSGRAKVLSSCGPWRRRRGVTILDVPDRRSLTTFARAPELTVRVMRTGDGRLVRDLVPMPEADLAFGEDGDEAQNMPELLREALTRLTRSHAVIWQHPAVWRVLIPAAPAAPGDHVVVANLSALATENLFLQYPRAVALSVELHNLSGSRRGIIWDGRRSPIRSGAVSLLVCADLDCNTRPALQECLAPSAEVVSIVSSRTPFDYALYPRPEELEWVTRRGWPLMGSRSVRRHLARRRATTRLWNLMNRAGLRVESGRPSLADSVLAQLSESTGERGDVRGVFTGRGRGQVTIRARLGRREVAIRVGLTKRGIARLKTHESTQAMVSGDRGRGPFVSVPEPMGSGWVGDVFWIAEEWLRGQSGPGGPSWRPSGRGWTETRAVAATLAGLTSTGATGPGWAARWGEELPSADPVHCPELLEALGPIEHAPMPTSWSHGDLWPGNVFLRKPPSPPLVIDWDRARADAPSGLDAVYAEIYKVVLARAVTLGGAAAWLIATGSNALAGVEVGGRSWEDWEPAVRRALITAAFVRNASGGSAERHQWDEAWVEKNVSPVIAALRQAARA